MDPPPSYSPPTLTPNPTCSTRYSSSSLSRIRVLVTTGKRRPRSTSVCCAPPAEEAPDRGGAPPFDEEEGRALLVAASALEPPGEEGAALDPPGDEIATLDVGNVVGLGLSPPLRLCAMLVHRAMSLSAMICTLGGISTATHCSPSRSCWS